MADAPMPNTLTTGWQVLTQVDKPGSGPNSTSGFTARVSQNTASGEIVISYAGTEIDTTSPVFQAAFIPAISLAPSAGMANKPRRLLWSRPEPLR